MAIEREKCRKKTINTDRLGSVTSCYFDFFKFQVIATNVPAGDEDMESMDTNYYEGILHNIMIGKS